MFRVGKPNDAAALALPGENHVKQGFFKAHGATSQCAVSRQHKAASLKHDLILPTHQVGIQQGQARGADAFAHGGFTFPALPRMKW